MVKRVIHLTNSENSVSMFWGVDEKKFKVWMGSSRDHFEKEIPGSNSFRENLCGIVANVLNCSMVVNLNSSHAIMSTFTLIPEGKIQEFQDWQVSN